MAKQTKAVKTKETGEEMANRLANGFAEVEAREKAVEVLEQLLNDREESSEREAISRENEATERLRAIAEQEDDMNVKSSRLDIREVTVKNDRALVDIRLREAEKAVKKAERDEANLQATRALVAKEKKVVEGLVQEQVKRKISAEKSEEGIDEKLRKYRDLEAKKVELDKRAKKLDDRETIVEASELKIRTIKEQSKSRADNLEVKEKELKAFEDSLDRLNRDLKSRETRFKNSVKSK